MICIKVCCVAVLQIWLTENTSNSLSPQVGDKGAEEGAHEGVLQECHVMERVGGVQQTENCRDQIREEIHLWNMTFLLLFVHFTLTFFIQLNI